MSNFAVNGKTDILLEAGDFSPEDVKLLESLFFYFELKVSESLSLTPTMENLLHELLPQMDLAVNKAFSKVIKDEKDKYESKKPS